MKTVLCFPAIVIHIYLNSLLPFEIRIGFALPLKGRNFVVLNQDIKLVLNFLPWPLEYWYHRHALSYHTNTEEILQNCWSDHSIPLTLPVEFSVFTHSKGQIFPCGLQYFTSTSLLTSPSDIVFLKCLWDSWTCWHSSSKGLCLCSFISKPPPQVLTSTFYAGPISISQQVLSFCLHFSSRYSP